MRTESSATMYACRNHPHAAAETQCMHCAQPFCSSCTVEFLGKPHCGPCRDIRLHWMAPPAAPASGSPHAKTREQVLTAGAITLGVAGFVYQLGIWPLAVAFTIVAVLIFVAALVLHILSLQAR